ncbi:hypothetical protein FOC84_26465 [Achromobacter pestifer]|uniref:Uncharacterized protein n=1 Tax=Achromobacter pestifer TaxID=1353889 RepID=A0A7D4E0C6_9BURK|nr:hypothetical protein [Achromobacter pestifer]QKH38288.1 hypothetical protein FOC84_26465 [Achromobacter pestifer]
MADRTDKKKMPSLSSSVPWQSSLDLRIQHMVWKCTNEGFAKEVRFRLVLENPGAVDVDQWPRSMCVQSPVRAQSIVLFPQPIAILLRIAAMVNGAAFGV